MLSLREGYQKLHAGGMHGDVAVSVMVRTQRPEQRTFSRTHIAL